jgi:O-6-methylguanine DNA methyltransferase
MSGLAGASIATPVGPLWAIATDDGLCALPFSAGGRSGAFESRLRRWFGSATISDMPDHDVVRRTRVWLEAYFAGDAAPLPRLDMRGSDFERTVWAALLEIAAGTTTSYGDIARRVGNANASRAVGLANGANPVPIIVPCHRVIGASGALTGYGGGLERKKWLLEHERRYWGREPGLIL